VLPALLLPMLILSFPEMSQQAEARLFAFILFVEHKTGAVLRSDNFAEDVKIVLRAINLFNSPCDTVCVSFREP
jgi:hypothetical protein